MNYQQTCFPKFDPALLHPMRELWEQALDISAKQIAERFNVTKNTIIGQAHRRGWEPRKVMVEPRTLHDRLDAAHAKLDAVLAETRPHVEGRVKLVLSPVEMVEAAE